MQIMCDERNGTLFSMDDRYCIDNGAMIGKYGKPTPDAPSPGFIVHHLIRTLYVNRRTFPERGCDSNSDVLCLLFVCVVSPLSFFYVYRGHAYI